MHPALIFSICIGGPLPPSLPYPRGVQLAPQPLPPLHLLVPGAKQVGLTPNEVMRIVGVVLPANINNNIT